MTLVEYDAAWRGYCERYGIKPEPDGMTRRRLDELKAMFPDAPVAEWATEGASENAPAGAST